MTIIEKQFEKFYKKIKLKEKQRKDAKRKYSGVCETLHSHYYSTKYDGDTKFLFGSYGKRTNIRPPRDVDVLFKLPPEEFDRYDSYQSNGQSALLQDIKTILQKKYATTEKISPWGKVILIEFSKNYHNVELLPAFEQSDGTFFIPNSENGGSWEVFDPKPDMEKLANKDKELDGLLRKVIRMLKKWNENISIDIKSYNLENWSLNYFNLHTGAENDSLPLIIEKLFEDLENQVGVDEQSHVKTALERAKKANEFESEGKEEDAIEEWIKIFGDDFPKNYDKQASTSHLLSQLPALQRMYPSEAEEFIESDYGFSMQINPIYTFKIDAEVTQDGFRPHILSYFLVKNWSLKKKKSLKFQVIKNDVPIPYSIYWKIRNFGEEAKSKGGLRGEIIRDQGRSTRNETTQYEGEHYVECYCIKDGVCVALDKILVPIKNE